jgi:hypothetical protein
MCFIPYGAVSLVLVPCWRVEKLQTYGHIDLLIEIYYVCVDGYNNVGHLYQTIVESSY